jgi:hypothetical protein
MERTTLDLRTPTAPIADPIPFVLTESEIKIARIAAACLELDRLERNSRDAQADQRKTL